MITSYVRVKFCSVIRILNFYLSYFLSAHLFFLVVAARSSVLFIRQFLEVDDNEKKGEEQSSLWS